MARIFIQFHNVADLILGFHVIIDGGAKELPT